MQVDNSEFMVAKWEEDCKAVRRFLGFVANV